MPKPLLSYYMQETSILMKESEKIKEESPPQISPKSISLLSQVGGALAITLQWQPPYEMLVALHHQTKYLL
jgi:hypothetical protein